MKFSEIKKIVESATKEDTLFPIKCLIPLAVTNIESIYTRNENEFETLCERVFNEYRRYVNAGGHADIYDFCSAIDTNLEYYGCEDNNFDETIKDLDLINWGEVCKDADEELNIKLKFKKGF